MLNKDYYYYYYNNLHIRRKICDRSRYRMHACVSSHIEKYRRNFRFSFGDNSSCLNGYDLCYLYFYCSYMKK